MAAQIETLVRDALANGSLIGRGYGKTITVAGKRRYTIRVQSDIFRVVQNDYPDWFYYPDLVSEITEAVAWWRAQRKA